jgi:hypothetical protein
MLPGLAGTGDSALGTTGVAVVGGVPVVLGLVLGVVSGVLVAGGVAAVSVSAVEDPPPPHPAHTIAITKTRMAAMRR